MYGLFASLLVAALISFSVFNGGIQIPPNKIALFDSPFILIGMVGMVGISCVLFVLHLLISVLSFTALQKSGQRTTSRIFDMLKKDRFFFFLSGWLTLFPLITIALVFLSTFNSPYLLISWIVMFGISLDCVKLFLRRTRSYLMPFHIVKICAREAEKCVRNEQEVDLCDWLDALSEISIKAMREMNLSLCNHSTNEMQLIMRDFLESSKSISHHSQDSQTQAYGIKDKITFTLFFFFQRLESIYDLAIEKRLDFVCTHLVTLLGKIIVHAAKYDLSLMIHPLQFFGNFIKSAQEKKIKEIGLKASCTLIELSKVILNEVDLTYFDLKEPFLSLNRCLEEITKEMFRQNKTLNVKALSQSFLDLKELFKNEKMATHQDLPLIMLDIDRVIDEFNTLDQVLRARPLAALPKEDLPTGLEIK